MFLHEESKRTMCGSERQCTRVSVQLNVILMMIPGLYIPAMQSSNCIQATLHNIDQCV